MKPQEYLNSTEGLETYPGSLEFQRQTYSIALGMTFKGPCLDGA